MISVLSPETTNRPLSRRAPSHPKPLANKEKCSWKVSWFRKDYTQYKKKKQTPKNSKRKKCSTDLRVLPLKLFFMLWLESCRNKTVLLCFPVRWHTTSAGHTPSSPVAHDPCLGELQARRSPFPAVTDYWRVKQRAHLCAATTTSPQVLSISYTPSARPACAPQLLKAYFHNWEAIVSPVLDKKNYLLCTCFLFYDNLLQKVQVVHEYLPLPPGIESTFYPPLAGCLPNRLVFTHSEAAPNLAWQYPSLITFGKCKCIGCNQTNL